jgi:hypothetical protein
MRFLAFLVSPKKTWVYRDVSPKMYFLFPTLKRCSDTAVFSSVIQYPGLVEKTKKIEKISRGVGTRDPLKRRTHVKSSWEDDFLWQTLLTPCVSVLVFLDFFRFLYSRKSLWDMSQLQMMSLMTSHILSPIIESIDVAKLCLTTFCPASGLSFFHTAVLFNCLWFPDLQILVWYVTRHVSIDF